MIDLNQYKSSNVSKEELEAFTDAFMRAKYDNDRKKRWQGLLNQQHNLHRDQADQPTHPLRKRIYLWVSSAAAVAIVLIMWLFGPGTSSASYEQLADNYLTEEFYENREDSRGDQDVEQINLQAVFAYNNKDFSTAIGHYEAIVSSGQANDQHHFFLGLSYIYEERFDAAIINLLKVPQLNANSKFLQEHRWFLALAYLKNKQVNEGKAALLSIQSGEWKYQDAQLLLEAIER